MWQLLAVILGLVMLAGCGAGTPAAPDAAAAGPAEAATGLPPLPGLFDCLRENGGVVVAAHRGGPKPGFPEHAMETLERGYERGIRVFEVDVSESRDGVMFLHHDRRLNRTTTGDGYVADTAWEDIAALRLVDNDGRITAFNPAKLTDALLWAKARNVILELDRKETTSFRNIIGAVRAASAEGHVILITYNDDQAAEVARLAPDLMLTATAHGGRDIARLEARGVDRSRLIGWTGITDPDPAAFRRLRAEGVEPAFGTLGRRGERLDDLYWEDGDGSEYQDLVDQGLVLLATDEPYRVADWLTADDEGWAACAVQ